MSAISELCALLDARGAEWARGLGSIVEWVGANDRLCRAYARPEPLTVDVAMLSVPPAQAVDATLGRGTCRIRGGECDQCGAYIHEDACLNWVPVGEGMKTFERGSVNFCPNCGREVVE